MNFSYDPNKEDVYALGLILLSLGNGRSIQNIYNHVTGEVDSQKLNQHINEFKKNYQDENGLLVNTV